MDGLELGAVEFAGNRISADFGIGLGVEKFVWFDGNKIWETTVLGDFVESGLDTPENFIWQFL